MRTKKHLGQHFLRSEKAIRQMIDSADLDSDDVVLEIGPGEGVLTQRLLDQARRVVVIEKDNDLIPALHEKFADEIASVQLEIINDDALEFDTATLGVKKYKLVANIPYYITGQVFRKFLSSQNQPEHMVLLIQREVAERIVARDDKGSLLSLSVRVYGEPKYISTVPPGAFAPAPNVDSAILAISDISRQNFDSEKHEKAFFDLIHAGFAHKRKQIGGNLKLIVSEPEKLLNSVGIEPKTRAEDISLDKWLELARNMVENQQ